MKLLPTAALMAAALVSGCAYSSSDDVKPLPVDVAKVSYVSSIVVKSVPENVSPGFKDKLVTYLDQETKSCAKGAQPLRLEVSVAQFSSQNPGMTFLAGDSNKIKGTAQLIDPSTNNIVGDYDISRSFGAGGILGIALMSGAEDQMTQAFAKEVCDRAFASKQ